MFQYQKVFSGFSVNDIQKAKAFYKDKLGMDATEKNGLLFLPVSGGNQVVGVS